MARVRDIKNRIRSVSNTKKITRTMELVATAKAKSAVDRIEGAIPYFEALGEIASEARGQGGVIAHALLEAREVKRVAVLVIVANRGLCGGYNSSVLRQARDHRLALLEQGVEVTLIPSGGKAFSWLNYQNVPYDQDGYRQFEDKPAFVEVEKVAARLMKMFETGEVDQVDVCYTHFYSSGRQGPVTHTVLPLARPDEGDEVAVDQDNDYTIEPDPASILDALFPLQVKLDLFRAYLSAAASEQIARRIAMKNATDNAEDLVKNLKMLYNRLRQSQITKEILEVIGGAEALD
jgi:F-type H+-transporting ATPase subunit gamma